MAYIGRGLDKISNVEKLDNLTFDGSSTSYSLLKGGVSFTPSSANNILLSIDGVVQAGNFTVSGSTIDFGIAVSASSTCDFIIHYGVGVITTPSDGSVTTAKIQDSSVSLAKLTATGTQDATTFLRGDNTFAVPAGGTNTPAFLAYSSGSPQSISDATKTKVSIDTEILDSDSAYDTGTSRFTVPAGEGGYYHITGKIKLNEEGGESSEVELNLYKNGSQYTKNYFYSGGVGSGFGTFEAWGLTISAIVSLSAGDYVELYAYINETSGNSGSVSIGSVNTLFGGYKLIGV